MAKFVIVSEAPGDVIHGAIDNPAPCFLGLVYDPTTQTQKLIPATNVRSAHHLTRPVVSVIPLDEHVFSPSIVTPTKAGLEGSAQKVRDLEVEGDDNLIVSGTGAMTSATAAGTEIEYYQGKFRTLQGGNVACGKIVSLLPKNEVFNDARFFIELFYA